MAVAALTRGWSGLGLAYATVQLPMLTAMIRARARLLTLLLSPMVAAPLTVLAGAGLAFGAGLGQGAGLAVGGAVSVALGYGAGRLLGPQRALEPQHQRGTRLIDTGQAVRTRDRSADSRAPGLSLAGQPVREADEVKHFKIIGTTGTGKSTAIRELLNAALMRGDRAVIADPDGGYLCRYYDAKRGDIVLNPFDRRSVKWDLFAEIQQPYDVEQLARSLLPDHEGSDRSWQSYARTFLTAVTRQAHAAGVRSLAELYRLLVIAPVSELRELTAGTPAQPFLEEHNGRMFDSIRSVASSAVASLEHISRQQGDAFSLRAWVRQGYLEGGGVLFIPYRADQIAALRSTVSAWMRIAIFETMAGPEKDQRLWFVVDELDALGQIDGLKDALARVRKFGGRCVLGMQSIAQVASTYGSGEAHTIVENCGNTLILRCSASEGGGTSRFASMLIGQREVLRTTRSTSRRRTELFSAVTRSEQFSIEPAVMDSEIEQLPDLAGFLKLASSDSWCRVGLLPQKSAGARQDVPAFVPAPTASVSAPKAADRAPKAAGRAPKTADKVPEAADKVSDEATGTVSDRKSSQPRRSRKGSGSSPEATVRARSKARRKANLPTRPTAESEAAPGPLAGGGAESAL